MRSESIVAITLSALVAAGVSVFFAKGRDGADLAAPAPGPAEARAEVAALSQEVAAQKRALARLEEGLASVERSAVETREENAALREMVNDLLAAGAPAGTPRKTEGESALSVRSGGERASAGPGPDAATATGTGGEATPYGVSEATREAEVRAVMGKIRAEEEQKERERERERRVADAKQTVQRIAERLRLTPQQSEQLATLMVERDERRRQAWEQMREGGTPLSRDEMRTQRQALQAEYDTKVQAILDPQQYQELQKIREEQERGGGGDRGFGGQGFRGGRGGRQGGEPQPATPGGAQ